MERGGLVRAKQFAFGRPCKSLKTAEQTRRRKIGEERPAGTAVGEIFFFWEKDT